MSSERVYIYRRFERFWHWSQALLVVLLALTGFDMHFGWGLFEFANAVVWHRFLAWAFIVLIAFAIFWHLTTGEWRQYVPGGNIIAMVFYYTIGIFRKEPHPVEKTQLSKLNPLQKLAYSALKLLVIPVTVTTGFLYYYNNFTEATLGQDFLRFVALVHTLAAYLLIAFMCFHVYLTTTGRTPLSNIKAMISGYEDLDA